MSSPSRSLILSLILVATITSFLSYHLYGFKETFANGGPVNSSNLSTFASSTTNTTFGSTTNPTFAAPQQTTGPSTFASPNTNPTLENTTTTSNSTSTSTAQPPLILHLSRQLEAPSNHKDLLQIWQLEVRLTHS